VVRQPWRLDARGQRLFDRALVAALLLPVVAMAFAGFSARDLLLCVGEIAPLVARRRWPVHVFLVIAAVSLCQALLSDSPLWGQVGFPIATYSVARYRGWWPGVAAVGIGLVGAVIGSAVWLRGFDALSWGAFLAYFLSIGAIVVSAWALGTLARTREEYVESLVERGRQLEREAAQQAELAAAEERARIAREMHDVVAHGLSVIVVQADGARYAVTAHPEKAAAALETIGATGREALTEMRQLLGLLRRGSARVDGPQPTLAAVPELVEEARAAGTQLEADLPEPLPPVPEGVGLTAYRVVQEALTNVRKHAGPAARARLTVHERAGTLAITVRDDGRGAAAPVDGRGLGLIGMRERVELHGGELEAGPAPGGGFAVSARIPV
jgi:signal transduction histidine kinase